ncbi:hypothetical protein FQR65_LT09763 [Abscondita terminalis]|nr:hypothetical protein FQR65_LT09763 [Abscondita terminalis]
MRNDLSEITQAAENEEKIVTIQKNVCEKSQTKIFCLMTMIFRCLSHLRSNASNKNKSL